MIDMENKNDVAVIEEMKKFIQNGKEITWTAAIRDDDGVLHANDHKNRPCYGEMRNYGKDSTRPNDYHPDDLPRPIRRGIREAVAVYTPTHHVTQDQADYLKYVFGPDSPYRAGFDPENTELIPHPTVEGRHSGVIIKSGNFKPTVLVHLLIRLRDFYLYSYGNEIVHIKVMRKFEEVYPGRPKSFYDYLGMFFHFSGHVITPYNWSNSGYSYSWNTDPKRFMIGSTVDLDEGRVWSDPTDYNRPWLPEIFNPLAENIDVSPTEVPMGVRSSAAAGMDTPIRKILNDANLPNQGQIWDTNLVKVCEALDRAIS